MGLDELKPMMIKDVAEEIGVHPSTVSRAVAASTLIHLREFLNFATSSLKLYRARPEAEPRS